MNHKIDLTAFSKELVEEWTHPTGKNDLVTRFEQLSKDDIISLIDAFLEEADDIKIFNKLLRIQEAVKVVFDHKLAYQTIKTLFTEGVI